MDKRKPELDKDQFFVDENGELVEISKFKGGQGNPQALRDWYNEDAKNEIKWGTPGDLTRCHAIASKYMDSDLAWGFCQERNIDVLGEPNATTDQKETTKK